MQSLAMNAHTSPDRLFVYGSLTDTTAPRACLPGFAKRTDADYPTIAPESDSVVPGHILTVSDWEEKDEYERHIPDDPENSLYWRLQTADNVYVYIGNPEEARRYWGTAWDVEYDRATMQSRLNTTALEHQSND